MQRCTLLRLCFVCISLGMGICIYFFARAGPAIQAIPDSLEYWVQFQPLLGSISNQLPSFLHTYAFILLTFIVLGGRNRHDLLVSITLWLGLESLFEIGQHAMFAGFISRISPVWCEQIPAFDFTRNYFLQGTFDPLDLFAIVFATVAAWLTIQATSGKE